MIREFTIENFKSIESLTLPLGRVTVLIGENGAGKSNVLEAIAFYGAAVLDKLDPEFLYARGVRLCAKKQTLAGFDNHRKTWRRHAFHVSANSDGMKKTCDFVIFDSVKTGDEIDGWGTTIGPPAEDKEIVSTTLTAAEWKLLKNRINELGAQIPTLPKDVKNVGGIGFAKSFASNLIESDRMLQQARRLGRKTLSTPFVIFSPENTALRTFESEGQMRPLGVRGEGLFKLVQHFAEHQPAKFKLLRNELKLFDWFEDFAIPKRLGIGESRLDIKDRFLAAKRLLDQRSANEGFLFLLFYLCLFLSPQTPKFFAIDNIDASLNPKLCAEMMRRLVALAKQEDKQVVITTHNPAILDGLDLSDKEQMLYAIQRNEKGRTIAQRIPAPKPQPGEPALKLSHAYLRGLLGGVPKNF
jgi:predicted ATPase